MAKFQKGKSGNPKGRPRGRPSKYAALKKRLETKAGRIVDAVIDRALEGDSAAQRLCMERLIPAAKPGDEMGAIQDLGSEPMEIAQNAFVEVGRGKLSVAQAERIIGLADRLCNVLDYKGMEARLTELEEN
jgi:hypothetical protein